MVATTQPENGTVGLTSEDNDTRSKNRMAQYLLSLWRRTALTINTGRIQDMSDARGSRLPALGRALRALATWVGLRSFARARGLRMNLIPITLTPKHSKIALPLMLASTCLVLSACEKTDRSGTTFRTFSAIGGESISIDAHQRAIITTEVRDEDGQPRLIYCAEPSPDAFASINSTLNRSLAAKAEHAENKGEITANSIDKLTSVASAALNARNATIQLLRDGLYRACEAYATGALSRNEYVGIVGQYQNVMLALLTVELLANINAQTATADDAKSSDDGYPSDESERGSGSVVGQAPTQPATSGLSEGSIKIMAETAERLVARVLGIERQRALQPRLAECVQRVRAQPDDLGTVLVQWCEMLMLKYIEKESFGDRLGGSNDTLDFSNDAPDLLDDVTAAIADPAGDIAVGESTLVHFEDGERLKVFTLKVDRDGRYDIRLSNDSTSPDGDPALIVTTADLDIVSSDDDSGRGLNAIVEGVLDAGHYHIHVVNVGNNRATFSLSVERRETGDVEEDSEAGMTSSQVDLLSQADEIPVDDIIRDFVDQLVEESQTPTIKLDIGVEHRLEFTPDENMQTLTFEISNAGHYIVEVSTELENVGDPAVILLDEEGSVLDADDDSGDGFDARVERQLAVGKYQMHVLNLDSSGAVLKVLVAGKEAIGNSVREPSGGRALRG